MVLLIKSSLQFPAPQEHTGDYCSASCPPGLPTPFLHSFYLAQFIVLYGVIAGLVQGFDLPLLKVMMFLLNPCLQTVKAPRNGSLTLQHISYSPSLFLFASPLGGYSMLLVINEEFKQRHCQYQPASSATGTQLPVGLRTSDHQPFRPTSQQFYIHLKLHLSRTYLFSFATRNTMLRILLELR